MEFTNNNYNNNKLLKIKNINITNNNNKRLQSNVRYGIQTTKQTTKKTNIDKLEEKIDLKKTKNL